MTKHMLPLPFLALVLHFIARHEMYSFMDGFNGYNKVKMAKKIKRKQHSFWNGLFMFKM